MEKSRFRYLEDVATADAAFVAYGADLPELFSHAAQAMFNVMAPLDLISADNRRTLEVTADSVEELLFAFLADLIYLKDVNTELYSSFEIVIEQKESWRLHAEIGGRSLSELRADTHTDVKAVTYHRLAIQQTENGFEATVVVDL